MEKSKIIELWSEFFPSSLCVVGNVCLDGGVSINGYIGNGKDEWANRISHNDVLSYLAIVDKNGDYREVGAPSLCVQPKEAWLYCSSEKMRKKSIMGLDAVKLAKRFAEIRAFWDTHKTDVKGACFDVMAK